MARIDSISKAFDPNEAENRLYSTWMNSGYFKPKAGKKGKKFSVVMPPSIILPPKGAVITQSVRVTPPPKPPTDCQLPVA